MADSASSRDIVTKAFREAGGILSPQQVEEWWVEREGEMPVGLPAIRAQMVREATRSDGLLEKVAYGSYRLRRPARTMDEVAAEEDDGAVMFRIDLPNGSAVHVSVLVTRTGPPVVARAVSSAPTATG